MSPNPIQHIATELARYAINVNLIAQQFANQPNQLTGADAELITPAVQQLQRSVAQLQTTLTTTSKGKLT